MSRAPSRGGTRPTPGGPAGPAPAPPARGRASRKRAALDRVIDRTIDSLDHLIKPGDVVAAAAAIAKLEGDRGRGPYDDLSDLDLALRIARLLVHALKFSERGVAAAVALAFDAAEREGWKRCP